MTTTTVRTSVHVQDINVSLGRKPIVNKVSFDVQGGDWLNIIGPNGAGKTSLLKALAGVTAHTGTISVNGARLDDMSHRDRACWVAYVAQNPIFPQGMHVVDYVMLGRTAHLSMLATESPRDIELTYFVLEELNLLEFADRDVATLSGGERQRASIARALAQASPLILLDEPTSALDIGMQQEVLSLINKLRHEKQLAVISTMHDLSVSGMYPDRLLLMGNGHIKASGTPEQVLTAENISREYGAKVQVIQEKNRIIVVPDAL